GTAELAESLARQSPVRVLRRPGRLGLATAVVDGWKLARGDLLAVMDADLQHPPEVLGELVRALREGAPGTDVAVASRYMSGGGTGHLAAWARYLAVGLTGATIDLVALYLAAERLGWPLLAAVPPAIEIALVSNFFLNETLTFRSCRASEHEIGSRESGVGSQGLLSRFLRYEKACALGALLNALVTLALVKSGIRLLTAAAAGVLAGGVW